MISYTKLIDDLSEQLSHLTVSYANKQINLSEIESTISHIHHDTTNNLQAEFNRINILKQVIAQSHFKDTTHTFNHSHIINEYSDTSELQYQIDEIKQQFNVQYGKDISDRAGIYQLIHELSSDIDELRRNHDIAVSDLDRLHIMLLHQQRQSNIASIKSIKLDVMDGVQDELAQSTIHTVQQFTILQQQLNDIATDAQCIYDKYIRIKNHQQYCTLSYQLMYHQFTATNNKFAQLNKKCCSVTSNTNVSDTMIIDSIDYSLVASLKHYHATLHSELNKLRLAQHIIVQQHKLYSTHNIHVSASGHYIEDHIQLK